MNDFDEIFARANIQQIREFFLHGTEACCIHTDSYIDRVEMPLKKVAQRVGELCANEQETEKMMAIIYAYSTAVEEVNMEIGVQVGMMICLQMYPNFKKVFEGQLP